MAKRRTKAQRIAAAKQGWIKRHARENQTNPNATPISVLAGTGGSGGAVGNVRATPLPLVEYSPQAAPSTARVVREGADLYIIFADENGTLRRRITQATASSLLKDLAIAII
jgi:hypothetical protein